MIKHAKPYQIVVQQLNARPQSVPHLGRCVHQVAIIITQEKEALENMPLSFFVTQPEGFKTFILVQWEGRLGKALA